MTGENGRSSTTTGTLEHVPGAERGWIFAQLHRTWKKPDAGQAAKDLLRTLAVAHMRLRACARAWTRCSRVPSILAKSAGCSGQKRATRLELTGPLLDSLYSTNCVELLEDMVRQPWRNVKRCPGQPRALAMGSGQHAGRRGLAIRCQALSDETGVLDAELHRLTVAAAPARCQMKVVGPDAVGALLVAAGDNPERLRSEAAFASLCGVSPLPASSGKTIRHWLNWGGGQISNNALWRIVMTRLPCDEWTQEGHSKREIIRCLKRYVAREVYRQLIAPAALAAAA